MLRKIVLCLAGGSLVLFILFSTLWIRSYWYGDRLRVYAREAKNDGMADMLNNRPFEPNIGLIESNSGSFHLVFLEEQFFLSLAESVPYRSWPLNVVPQGIWDEPSLAMQLRPWPQSSQFLGFAYSAGTTGPYVYVPTRAITVPYWFLAMVTCLLPLITGFMILRRRRLVRKGLCVHCSYDLRASTDRCPECGAEITPTKAEKAAT